MNFLLSFLIVFLLTVAGDNYGSSRTVKVAQDIKAYEAALELFKLDVGRYPSNEEGLAELLNTSTIENVKPGGYLKNIGNDPWGYPYHYQYPGIKNKERFDLWSHGADGIPGGDGFDSDSGNWPGGLTEQQKAASASNTKRMLETLPMAGLTGLLFSGAIYLGICLLRLSDGVPKRKSFTGKSIWIGIVILIIYLVLVIPLMAH